MRAGAILKKKRLEMNLEIKDVAELVGVPRSTVWRIEEGKMEPSRGMILRFELALDFSFEWEVNHSD